MEWETAFPSGPPAFQHKQPYLEILVQPQTKFRFRYRSEMTGKHGSLLGAPPTQPHTMMTRSVNQLTTTMYSPSGPSSSSVATSTASYGLIASDIGICSGGISTGVSGHVEGISGMPSSSTSFTHMQATFSGINGSKLYPTVKLHNYSGEAIIRCSLVCDTPPYYPHPHLLEMGHGTGITETVANNEMSYVEIPINSQNDHTAIFQGLNIIYVSKKGIRKQLITKMSQLNRSDNRRVTEERIDDLSLGINLNVVSLYFEAYIRDVMDPSCRLMCPAVVSNPIQHNKSTQTGELRIVRIDKHSSCCTGDEEVFILVEKVDKHNIQVKFFQENDHGQEMWRAYGKFSKLDVHHQYAIVFKTPPYRSFDIDTEVEVQVQLERPSDSATSASLPFIYKPIERLRKMPKRQSSRTGGGSGGRGRGSGFGGSGSRDPSEFPEGENEGDDAYQQPENKQGGNNLGSSSVRQGSNQIFPCDVNMLPMVGDPQSKILAVNVALSVCQGLHTWAETSDLNCILQKLRHLLCIVNENGDNALHTAIHNRQWEPFMKILETVDASPDIAYLVNEPNLHNLTPLALAVSTNSNEFVEELIKRKADISISNSEGDNPIHIAVKMNNVECLKCLLNSPNAKTLLNKYNFSSMTPLHIAAQTGNVEILQLLCDQKASVTIQEGTYGRTPLHLVVEKEEIDNISNLISLMQNCEDPSIVNIQNYRGDTPLHCAASLGHKTLCTLLLHFGADPLVENHIRPCSEDDEEDEEGNGQTVFDVAANDEIRNVLSAPPEEWAKVHQSCASYFSQLSSTERETHEQKVLTADSIFLDSGINITDLNIS